MLTYLKAAIGHLPTTVPGVAIMLLAGLLLAYPHILPADAAVVASDNTKWLIGLLGGGSALVLVKGPGK